MWSYNGVWNQHNPQVTCLKTISDSFMFSLHWPQEVIRKVQGRKIQQMLLKAEMCRSRGPWATSLRSYPGRMTLHFPCYYSLPWGFAAGHCQIGDAELDRTVAWPSTAAFVFLIKTKDLPEDSHKQTRSGNICWMIMLLRWSQVIHINGTREDSITVCTGSSLQDFR